MSKKRWLCVFTILVVGIFVGCLQKVSAESETTKGSGARIIDCEAPGVARFHFGGEVGSCEFVKAEKTGTTEISEVSFVSLNPEVCTITECEGQISSGDDEVDDDEPVVYEGKYWRLDRIKEGTSLVVMTCKVGDNQVIRSALVSAFTPLTGEEEDAIEGVLRAGETVYMGCTTVEGTTSRKSEIKEVLTTNREVEVLYECEGFYRVELLEGTFGDVEEELGYILKESVDIPVKGIDCIEGFSIYETQSKLLCPNIYPSIATDSRVYYESSNTNVASVDGRGNVMAVHPGRAVITTYVTSNPSLFCKTEVEVLPFVPVTGIRIDPTQLQIPDGTRGKLNVSVLPEDASVKDYQLSVDKNDCLTIDAKGYYTAKKPGTVVVTATSSEGGYIASSVITIMEVKATGISIQNTASINVNETKQLSWHMVPENSTDKRVLFTSSNPNVVSVDFMGRVTGKEVGTADIKIVSVEGAFEKSCRVSVEKYVQDIELDRNSIDMTLGTTEKLTFSLSPQDVTKSELVWNSDNKKVATVREDGTIQALSTGVAQITIYDRYTGAYDFCIVDVDADLSTPELSKTKNKKNGYVLQWKKVKRATSYKLYKYRSKKKSYEPIKTCKKSCRSYRIKKSSQSGSYRLKAYYKPNKEYSKFSKKVKVAYK